MDHKVYITPGSELRCGDPGWFRVVFAAVPHILEEGNLQYKGFVMSVTNKTALAGVKGEMERPNEMKSKQILLNCG